MRLLGQFKTFFLQDKISQVQKSKKMQVQFSCVKCRLKVHLVLFTYIYIYLKVTVKKIYNYSYLGFNTLV